MVVFYAAAPCSNAPLTGAAPPGEHHRQPSAVDVGAGRADDEMIERVRGGDPSSEPADRFWALPTAWRDDIPRQSKLES